MSLGFPGRLCSFVGRTGEHVTAAGVWRAAARRGSDRRKERGELLSHPSRVSWASSEKLTKSAAVLFCRYCLLLLEL